MFVDSEAILLEVRNLSLARLWRGLSFVVGASQMLQIVGANGAGKTSLIRVLCGLINPDQGRVLWQRRNIHRHIEDYHREITYIGHKDGIKSDLTPRENLAFSAAVHGLGTTHAKDNSAISIDDALHHWQLTGIHTPCRALSAGQRRRVALARLLLAGAARLWFLDEPFTALDSAGRQGLCELIATHLNIGGAVIMSTHQVPDWSFSPQILNLNSA